MMPRSFRPPLKRKVVYRGYSLSNDTEQRLNIDFPIGGFYHRMDLIFHHALTAGSAASPVTDGQIKAIKGITFESPLSERFVDSTPGLPLYYFAKCMGGAAPQTDAIAASDATYDTHIPIYFQDPRSKFPRDTVIDSRRYENLYLTLNLGGLSDMFGTTTGASLTTTVDIILYVEEGPNLPSPTPPGGEPTPGYPIGYREYKCLTPIDPSSVSVYHMERAADLLVQRYFIGASTSGTSGKKFSGTMASSVIDTFLLRDVRGNLVDKIDEEDVRYINTEEYNLETGLTGLYMFDFIGPEGSVANAIQANPQNTALLDFEFEYDTLSTSYITVMQDGIRFLRG